MKKKQIILLAGLLAALAAIYGILVFQNKKSQEKEQAREESQTVRITEADEIQFFSFQAPEQEELQFKKKDGKWICVQDKKFPLDQTYPDRIVNTFSGLTAVRKLEDIDALEDYGLESPSYTVTMETAKGEKITLNIGDGTGEEYYLQKGGEDQVIYTVASSSVEALNYSLEDMEEKAEETTEKNKSEEPSPSQ